MLRPMQRAGLEGCVDADPNLHLQVKASTRHCHIGLTHNKGQTGVTVQTWEPVDKRSLASSQK